MTNKLVVIINSLKVPKIKKTLLFEKQFLVPNYSCLHNPWLGGLPPADPRFLCPLSSTEFTNPPPNPNKIPGYATHVIYLKARFFEEQTSDSLHTSPTLYVEGTVVRSWPRRPCSRIFLVWLLVRFAGASYGRSVNVCSRTVGDG